MVSATGASQTITVPGVGRPTLRRSANDPVSGLTAYVVNDPATAASHVKVSLRRGGRLVGATLSGHRTSIVDMEFLTNVGGEGAVERMPGSDLEIYTLGTCDKDGVVFLWFLDVVRDALRIETALKVRRKYSFYSLRKSRDAHYSRIRLAGTIAKGSMVLVPNDGSNVRIIGFSCSPDVDGAVPRIEGPPPPRALEAPPPDATDAAAAAALAAGAPQAPPPQSSSSAAAGAAVAAGAAGAGIGAAALLESVEGEPEHPDTARTGEYEARDEGSETSASSSSEDNEVDSDELVDDDYGADETVEDYEDAVVQEESSFGNESEFKDAAGVPQAQMAT